MYTKTSTKTQKNDQKSQITRAALAPKKQTAAEAKTNVNNFRQGAGCSGYRSQLSSTDREKQKNPCGMQRKNSIAKVYGKNSAVLE